MPNFIGEPIVGGTFDDNGIDDGAKLDIFDPHPQVKADFPKPAKPDPEAALPVKLF